MKSWLSFLVLMLCASVALAEPPQPVEPPQTEAQKKAAELVNNELVKPLIKAESKRARFSRAALPPVQRRVRVLDAEAQTDVRGKGFVRFAIDERRSLREDSWATARVQGCAYPGDGEVYVRKGDAYVHARSKLGKSAKERADVCTTAAQGATLAKR